MEYLIARCEDRREVLVDDNNLGFNQEANGDERVLEISSGLHTVRLGGNHDYNPLAEDIDIQGTSREQPLIITFKKITH